MKTEGISSIYGHRTLANAITGFIDGLPNKRDDYLVASREFLTKMYTLGSATDTKYFLDKSPRYHLIVDDLIEAFPDAKFIFLWRNPLAVASSMINTWGKGQWNLYMFWVDLYRGIDSLTLAFNNNKDRSLAIRYEDLASAPDKELAKAMAYLELENNDAMIEAFSKSKTLDAPGRGDPTGQYKYQGISQGSMDSWKSVMANPFRKAWSRNYLEWVGNERLDIMGYDKDHLESELDNQPVNYTHLGSDILRSALGKIYCKYALEEIRSCKAWRDSIYFPKN